ncbi:unnamed protein product [Lymnaea stagnalis]|uniref:Origin recognition complex subunit 6 n=1 Tax=Lymnaea stagnalis TaxID=6523 RepID=A0AAV2IE32_LYMST
MSNSNSILATICEKLGVEKRVKIKAAELNELLEARAATSLSALKLTGSCKFVVCVDLASKIYGCTLNQVDVVRLSSMNKRSYCEAAKVIASILELEDRVTLRELAIQYGCSGIVNLANNIIQRYTRDQCSDVDFYSPMFLCAALIVASRAQKIKMNVGKLRERSGIKKATLDKLINEMEKYVEPDPDSKKQTPTKKRGLMEAIEAQIENLDGHSKKTRSDASNGEGSECGLVSKSDYEEWKKKILAKAQSASS